MGREHLREGSKNGSKAPRWVGIHDDKSRLMVAGWFNQDAGDSREFAGDPVYPAKFSEPDIRLGLNTILYAMSHQARGAAFNWRMDARRSR